MKSKIKTKINSEISCETCKVAYPLVLLFIFFWLQANYFHIEVRSRTQTHRKKNKIVMYATIKS